MALVDATHHQPDPLQRQAADRAQVSVSGLLPPAQFVDRILVGALHARVVFVGDDFRFGVRGSGDVDTLRELRAERGLEVVSIDDVRLGGGRRASSTWIRELLEEPLALVL